MKHEIIKLTDDAVVDIKTDYDCYSLGCPTCGYGSDFCTTMEIRFKNHNAIGFENHNMYEYDEAFSVGYFIKLFCSNNEKFSSMTAEEFIDFITTEITRDFDCKVLYW